MSNEELAAKVKEGDPEATLLLWEGVRRFVERRAWSYKTAYECKEDVEDFVQAGFIAMLKATEKYDPACGWKFLTQMVYYLKTAFAEVVGIRTSKRDALRDAISLDAPRNGEDGDGESLAYFKPDETASLAFIGVEYENFIQYTQRVILAALDTLPEAQRVLLHERYIMGHSLKRSAEVAGYNSKQAAREAVDRAIYRLKSGKYSQHLRACLSSFDDYREYEAYARGGSRTFYRSGVSSTEAAAMLNTDGGTKTNGS